MNTQDIIRFLSISQAERVLLDRFVPLFDAAAEGIFAAFYARLGEFSDTARLIADPKTVARLKTEQAQHWKRLLTAEVDDTFVKASLAVGHVHARVGLDPGAYMAGYAFVQNQLSALAVQKLKGGKDDLSTLLGALNKLISLDMAIALSAYEGDVVGAGIDEHELAERVAYLRQMAGLTASVNDVMVTLAELVRDARDVNSSAQSIASAAEELVASVGTIADNSESAAGDARMAAESVQEGQQAADAAIDGMRHIAETVDRTQHRVDELGRASEKIGEILVSIEAIAKQTNLLALNATIEAARAGEAGKGFAVVAGEVKNLANQTARATDDIRQRVGSLQSDMGHILEAMQESSTSVGHGQQAIESTGSQMSLAAQQVQSVESKMADIADILQQQSQASAEISGGISSVADKANHNSSLVALISDSIGKANDLIAEAVNQFQRLDSAQAMLETAKIDHVLFKKRVMDAVMGKTQLTSSDIPDHHNCRFGKWYDAVTDKATTSMPQWKAIQMPHSDVHAAAKKALDLHHAGDLDAALEAVKRMNKASEDVIMALDVVSTGMDK